MTGAELKAFRRELGLTQFELAQALQMSDGRTVRRWENGERAISPLVAMNIRTLVATHRSKADPAA